MATSPNVSGSGESRTFKVTPNPPAPPAGKQAAKSGLGRDTVTLTHRAGTPILFGNPFTDSEVNASFYGAIPAIEAYALDKLGEKFPEVNRNFAARFLEMTLVTAGAVPTMVYSHEMGHYRAAANVGGTPSIQLTGYASALTWYNLPPGKDTIDNEAIIDGAGVTQQQINAAHMYEKWARNGGGHYEEAMSYLLAQTNLALYAANTERKKLTGQPIPSSDDIADYIQLMNQKGDGIKLEHLVTMSLAADLASAPVWAALLSQLHFLEGKGDKFAIPTFQIGDLKATFPNMHVLLTSNGPVIGGNLIVGPDRKVPVELSFDMRAEQGNAAAFGAKLFDIPLAAGVTLNPFIRGTYDSQTGSGVEVGTEVQAKLSKSVSLIGSVSYQHNDLLAEPTGVPDGALVHVGLSFAL